MKKNKTICETIGSVLERYHNHRFMSLGMEQDSTNMDNEMWVARNGPRMMGGDADVILESVTRNLAIPEMHGGRGTYVPTQDYLSTPEVNRRRLTSTTIQNLEKAQMGTTPSFFRK